MSTADLGPIRRVSGPCMRTALLLLIACKPVEAFPIVAPAGLDVTLDPGSGGLVLEDTTRRHAAPPAMMQRRVYEVETRFPRWYPPMRPHDRRVLRLAPFLPDYPADRVALRGEPVPLAGQRFVVFDEHGPRGVVEPTGERCPPGHEDCIACASDDPERLHWMRYVGPVTGEVGGFALAVGPFAPDETLPDARDLSRQGSRRIGRWELDQAVDLDGDGATDLADAITRERDASGNTVWLFEKWRLYEGRWYAEPQRPESPHIPMHVLDWDVAHGIFAPQDTAAGWIALAGSDLDGYGPVPGDYRILGRRGEIGTVNYPGTRDPGHCWYDGPQCHAVQRRSRTQLQDDPILLIGPVPADRTILKSKAGPHWREWRYWEPNRTRLEIIVEFSDGVHWTMTRRPCALIENSEARHGWCHEGREGGPGIEPKRWMAGEFDFDMTHRAIPVCRRLGDG